MVFELYEFKILAAQSCMTLCDPMDCSPPGSSVHGIPQARILVWAAISFSRGSSQPRDWIWVSCIAGEFFTNWATREAPWLKYLLLFPLMSLAISFAICLFHKIIISCITKCMIGPPTKMMMTRLKTVDQMYSFIYDQWS